MRLTWAEDATGDHRLLLGAAEPHNNAFQRTPSGATFSSVIASALARLGPLNLAVMLLRPMRRLCIILGVLLASCRSLEPFESHPALREQYAKAVAYVLADSTTRSYLPPEYIGSEGAPKIAVFDRPQSVFYTSIFPEASEQEYLAWQDSLEISQAAIDSLIATQGNIRGLSALSTDGHSPFTMYLSLPYKSTLTAVLDGDAEFVRSGRRTPYGEWSGFRGCWMEYLFYFDPTGDIDSVRSVRPCE